MKMVAVACQPINNKLGNYPCNRALITPIIPQPVGHIIRYNEDNINDDESFDNILTLIINQDNAFVVREAPAKKK